MYNGGTNSDSLACGTEKNESDEDTMQLLIVIKSREMETVMKHKY